jgi:hypothetical protein
MVFFCTLILRCTDKRTSNSGFYYYHYFFVYRRRNIQCRCQANNSTWYGNVVELHPQENSSETTSECLPGVRTRCSYSVPGEPLKSLRAFCFVPITTLRDCLFGNTTSLTPSAGLSTFILTSNTGEVLQ